MTDAAEAGTATRTRKARKAAKSTARRKATTKKTARRGKRIARTAARAGAANGRGRARKFPDDAAIRVVWKAPKDWKQPGPRRGWEGEQWELMATSKTVGEYFARKGSPVSLYYNWRRGWITIGGQKSDRPEMITD